MVSYRQIVLQLLTSAYLLCHKKNIYIFYESEYTCVNQLEVYLQSQHFMED